MTSLLTGGTRSREVLDDDVDLARDRVLVTRAQEGDRTAFDDLYVRYYRRLHRFCLRRLHDGYEAEDVAQEAFARAWRALPNFAGDRRFYPWLSVIAAHLCTDVLRRRNRSTPVAEFHQGNIVSNEDGGEELMIAAVDSDLVARAFQRLSDRHQRILNLREGSGWSYQRIADHEGVGITAIETLLWRARQALKREFTALAGSEGRTAAWIGGIISLATLRRLLRFSHHAARRVVELGQGASTVAVGSAAAATAMVVAATLSGPAPVTPSHGLVSTSGASGAAAATSAHGLEPSLLGGTGSSGSGSPQTPGAATPGNTGGGGLGLPSAANGVPGSATNALQGASSTAEGTLGNLGSDSIGGAGGLGTDLGKTLQGIVPSGGSGGSGSISLPLLNLNGGASTPSSLPGALGSASQPVSSTVQTVLGSVAGDTGSTGGTGLLGGGSSAGTGSGGGSTGSGSSSGSGGSTTPGGTSGGLGTVSTTVTTIACTVTGVVGTLTGSGSNC